MNWYEIATSSSGIALLTWLVGLMYSFNSKLLQKINKEEVEKLIEEKIISRDVIEYIIEEKVKILNNNVKYMRRTLNQVANKMGIDTILDE